MVAAVNAPACYTMAGLSVAGLPVTIAFDDAPASLILIAIAFYWLLQGSRGGV